MMAYRYFELLCVIDKKQIFTKRVLQSEKSCSILQATKTNREFLWFSDQFIDPFFEAVRFDFRKT